MYDNRCNNAREKKRIFSNDSIRMMRFLKKAKMRDMVKKFEVNQFLFSFSLLTTLLAFN